MTRRRESPRVALLAGGLSQGGAERQLFQTATALGAMGAEVRVLSLERDGPWGERLRSAGVSPVFAGRFASPPARVGEIAARLAPFRPHVVQASHSFVNLYAGLVGRPLGSLSLGALRSSLRLCREANGRWTRWLMTVPDAVVANSEAARRELCEAGLVPSRRVFVLPNAVDLSEFGPGAERRPAAGGPVTAAFVGRIVESKRLDVFLRAVALARAEGADVRGLVVGSGPALAAAQALAGAEGLLPHAVAFAGERSDVPALLAGADLLVLTSDDEGLPNVVLEGMAAGLPVVSTPAGEAARIVEDGVDGVLVPFGDAGAVADALRRLASAPELRDRLGKAGRRKVRRDYALEGLPARLGALYRSAAALKGRRLREVLS